MSNFLFRSSFEPYHQYLAVPAPEAAGVARLSVRFLGVTTLLISDGSTSLMTDGFFTRPGGFLRIGLRRKIEPDRQVIARCLEKAEVSRLAAVVPLHSHYDHAMDAPEVALQTGARLLGSTSSANIARGWGLPEDQIEVVDPGNAYHFGDFCLTFIESAHVPMRVDLSRGGTEIQTPLVPPVPALEYKVGQVYSLHVQHPLGNLLVHGSAGFVPGALAGKPAQVVFLSVGGLAHLDLDYKKTLFQEVVIASGASRLIPLHYDDFTNPLDQPLRLLPKVLDDIGASLDFIIECAAGNPRLDFLMLPLWEEVDIFEEPDCMLGGRVCNGLVAR